MSEKLPKPEEEQKPQTAIEIAFREAEKAKQQKEAVLGETLGNDIWKILSSPEEMQKLEDKEKGIDVDVSTVQTPQYMPPERWKEFQEETKRLGHTWATSSMAIANQKSELHQVETKHGLATEWQPDTVPLGRVMPRMVPADSAPLIQVETKPQSEWEDPFDPDWLQALDSFLREQEDKKKLNTAIVDSDHTDPVEVPIGRVMVPTDTEPLVQVETAPGGQAEDIGDKTSPYYEIEELDSQYPDHHAPSRVRREYYDLDAAVKESIASGDEGAQRIAMGRLDAFMTEPREGVRSENTIDLEQKEGTSRENRNRFKEFMSRAKEKLGMSELGEKLGGFLSKRSGELDVEAGKMGKGEKLFRTLGEKYNKLPMWQKVALGGSLAVGYGFTLPISSWFAGAYALPLFATRVAAMAGSFENNRKLFETINKGKAKGLLANTKLYKWFGSGSEKSRENTAMAKALIQSFGMTLGLSYAAHEIAEHHVAERIGQWMSEHIPSKAPEAPVAPHVPGGKIAGMPGTMQLAAAAAASDTSVPHAAEGSVVSHVAEVSASAEVPDVASINIEATKGHGSEYMMKRLWEDLREKGIKLPDGANQNSDLAKLLNADEKTIGSVVHQIASDPKHGFYNPDGSTNVRIDLGSHMTVGTDGNIQLNGATHVVEGVKMTPPYNPDVSGVIEPGIDEVTRQRALESVASAQAEASAAVVAPQEIAAQGAATSEVNVSAPHPAIEEHYLVDGSGDAVLDSQGSSIHTGSYEAPVVVSENVISNQFGLTISTAEPHIYANDAKSLFVYGGSPEEKAKMIKEYLQAHQDAVIYAEGTKGTRVPWYLTQGVIITEGKPVSEKGLLGIFSSFMKAPSPDDLKTRIK